MCINGVPIQVLLHLSCVDLQVRGAPSVWPVRWGSPSLWRWCWPEIGSTLRKQSSQVRDAFSFGGPQRSSETDITIERVAKIQDGEKKKKKRVVHLKNFDGIVIFIWPVGKWYSTLSYYQDEILEFWVSRQKYGTVINIEWLYFLIEYSKYTSTF